MSLAIEIRINSMLFSFPTKLVIPRVCQSISRLRPIVRRFYVSATSMACGSGSSGSKTRKNRLALEKSPYLLQHATNPVEWYPWGEEAIEKAKRENKPIFLSGKHTKYCHSHLQTVQSTLSERLIVEKTAAGLD